MKRAAGFTLVELMMALTVISILLAIGIPSFRYVTNANRAAAEVNGLVGDLMYARTEAVRQGTNVVVCVSADGQSCTNAVTWQGGWVVCAANAGTCDATTTVLRRQQQFVGSDTFTGTVSIITFNRVGFASGLGGGASFVLHDKTNNPVWTRCLSLSAIGAISVTNHTASPGTCT
ncbi:MAG: GspH/FimT family pseudopilin [Proteobacteria bacterium]|nr:GspH/FimT family pseudopilin [Pseudomonadota bacterium]